MRAFLDMPDFSGVDLSGLADPVPTVLAALLLLACAALLWVIARRSAAPAAADAPAFQAKPLLNRTEARLFRMIAHRVPKGTHVMAQTSYGEMLRCDSPAKFFTINARRADMVICDRAFNVLAVIEYQGSGHYGGAGSRAVRARRGDTHKRRALQEAGILLLEIPAAFDAATVEAALGIVFPAHGTARDPIDIRRSSS